MTVTLNLKPEVEAGLLAQAQASGLTIEQYLLSVVEQAAVPPNDEIPTLATVSAREKAVQRMIEFGDKYHLKLGEPVTRSLLHEGHRL